MVGVYLLFLAIGAGILWAGSQLAEEVYRIALLFSGAIVFLLGFTLTPDPVQLGMEVFLVGAVYRWTAKAIG